VFALAEISSLTDTDIWFSKEYKWDVDTVEGLGRGERGGWQLNDKVDDAGLDIGLNDIL